MPIMSAHVPAQFDPIRLAQRGARFAGSIAIAQLSRLRPRLASDQGNLSVQIEFYVHEQGWSVISGQITGSLECRCERCLQAMPCPVEIDFHLAAIESDALIERLPDGLEPLLLDGTTVSLREMVEDEVLLALPDVILHDLDQCPGREWIGRDPHQADQPVDTNNPFAALQELKDRTGRR